VSGADAREMAGGVSVGGGAVFSVSVFCRASLCGISGVWWQDLDVNIGFWLRRRWIFIPLQPPHAGARVFQPLAQPRER
jgi:hypothetical protein